MVEPLVLILLVVAVVVLVDLLLAGGAVTATCASGAMAVVAHPAGWIFLGLIAIAVLLVSGVWIAPQR